VFCGAEGPPAGDMQAPGDASPHPLQAARKAVAPHETGNYVGADFPGTAGPPARGDGPAFASMGRKPAPAETQFCRTDTTVIDFGPCRGERGKRAQQTGI